MAIKNYVISGKAQYAKIVGKPVGGYPDGNGPLEWTFDLIPDEASLEKLAKLGVSDSYIKTNKNGNKFVRFTRKAVKKDGSAGKPINIVDHKNQPWGTDLIGNDSTLNVSFTLNEVPGKVKKLKPSVLSVQVWDYVAYRPSTFKTKVDDTPKATEAWTVPDDAEGESV